MCNPVNRFSGHSRPQNKHTQASTSPQHNRRFAHDPTAFPRTFWGGGLPQHNPQVAHAPPAFPPAFSGGSRGSGDVVAHQNQFGYDLPPVARHTPQQQDSAASTPPGYTPLGVGIATAHTYAAPSHEPGIEHGTSAVHPMAACCLHTPHLTHTTLSPAATHPVHGDIQLQQTSKSVPCVYPIPASQQHPGTHNHSTPHTYDRSIGGHQSPS